MTAFEFIKELDNRIDGCGLPLSTEKPGQRASNSEIRRWFQKQSILVNNKPIGEKDEIQFPLTGLVFFPKGQRKCTFW